ncbi:DNRLRE domain-containing protein [Glutamicibacter soli]|uniref:DNRLRE domain-containing protein n=1 Tax=Glutamicibacter soli TaxID=453836 RepID=A0A6L9G9K4_9MICC|nr:DNRLRE domain-containing protein [Glutamicibacter soli]NAZ17804.1 DNRLRE domain-containing protein [Glutamicibacter soli]
MSLRTATEQVFANPDGTWTSETTSAARFKEEKGSFVPLGTDGELTDTASPVVGDGTELTIADGKDALGDGPTQDSVVLAELESTGEHEGSTLKLGWEGELPAPQISENQATYTDQVQVPVIEDPSGDVMPQTSTVDPVPSDTPSESPRDTNAPEVTDEQPEEDEDDSSSVPTPEPSESSAESSEPAAESEAPSLDMPADSQPVDASVIVEPLRSGFSHRTVLEQAPEGEVSLRFPIKLSKGLKLSKDQDTGDLRAVNGKGETVFFAPAPTMWDAKVDEASGLHPAERLVETTLTEEDGVPVLTLNADAAWLQDPERQYPVTIDPTWSSNASDTWVQADVPGSKAGDPELRVGTFNGGTLKSRSFLQFASTALDGKKITKAELRMHNYHSYSCTSSPVKVQRVTSEWISTDVRWTKQPTATSSGEGTNNVSKGYSSSCAAGYVYYPITPIAQYWADNPTKNYGVRLIAADETNNYTWKRYRSANYVTGANDPNEPTFVVTYNSYPGTPSAVSFGAGESVKDGSGKLWVKSKTPTFRSTVTDPDGGNVKAEFDMTGTSTLSKQAGSMVASKQVSLYKANLAENGTYTVKAWANDGTLRSKAAGAATTFTVDSIAPTAPTISSSAGITNNGWQASKPGSNTFTFSSSADTDKFSYQLNNEAWKTVAASSGKSTVSWNPTGANILRVKAIDKAANTSGTITWTFGNGVASLTSPAAGSTTSDSFKVTGQGPTSSTGAVTPKVYWREADSVTADTATYGSNAGWHEAASLPEIAAGQPVKLDTMIDISAAPAGKLKELGKDRIAALVELQVCFDYAGAPAASKLQCTTNKSKKPVQVTKLPHAFGDNYPVAEAGDGQVALTTGELNLSETDVEVNAGNTGLSVSRSYSSYSGIGANSRIFGKGWRANIDGPDEGLAGLLVAESTALDGTITLISDDETAAVFRQPGNGRVSLKTGTYQPANEDAIASGWKLVVSGSGTSARIKITEEDGTVTTFKRGANLEGNPKIWEWIAETVTGGNGTGTSKFVSNTAGQTTMVIAGTETNLNCEAATLVHTETTAVKGCRRINLSYDAAGKITKVTYTAWDPATSAMKTVNIAEYGYDGASLDSRLTSVKDSRTGDITTYTYGAESAAGVPLLASTEEKTSSGTRVDAPTYYKYGKANDSNRSDWLELVERGNAIDGNTRVQYARFVYGLNPSGDGANTPKLAESQVKLWEQDGTHKPVTGYAVFGPGKNIGSSKAASVAMADYKYADLQYVDAQNRVVNTASYAAGAWQLTANVFNAEGNIERAYDARAIRTIQAAAGTPANVVNGVLNSHEEHAQVNVYYSDLETLIDKEGNGLSTKTDATEKAEEISKNEATAEFLRGYVTDTYSPVTTDENDEPSRVHTKTIYTPITDVDAGGMPRMLPTTVATSKASSGKIDREADNEPIITQVENGYNAYTVDKNGKAMTDKNNLRSGWVIGSPTKVTQVMSASGDNIVTETRFDDQGRVIEARQPKSAGADAGTTKSIYYTAGANAADSDCGSKPEYAGYLCKNTPQGAGSVAKHQTGFNIYGQPATFTESSTGTDGAKRITTQTYRADGQEEKTTVTTSGITTTAVQPVEKLYDVTGVQNGVRAVASGSLPQSEVKWTQDLWGRTTSYTNSLGETTTTEYDLFGNVSKTVSPVSTTTYKYGALSNDAENMGEYQGVVTSMTVSKHGGTNTATYKATYDGDGNVLTQAIPGGFIQRMDYDESGKQVRLAYDGPLKAEDGTSSIGTWIAWELNRDVTGRIMGETTPEGDVLAGTSTAGDRAAAYDRAFTYDRAGRLTEVKDITATPGETVNTDPEEGAVTPTTVRKYAFDKNGNRASLTTTVNGTQTAKRTWAYDAADRVGVGAGYVYDGLGRQTTIPAADAPAAAGGVKAGAGAITVKYFADDAAAAITRNGTTSTIARDPAGRRLTVTSSGTAAAGTETKHYADDSDNPAWTTRKQGTETITTRYESTIGGDLALTITGNTVELAVNNPHGDVVATVPLTGTGAGQGITGWAQYDEYGNQLTEPVNTGATSYGWHGADERAVDTSGLILMGARLYNSVTGLFTSRDPVEGGNTTSYAYPQDPVGMNDISGMWSWRSAWSSTKSYAGRSWSTVKRTAGRVGSFAAKHWRNGNIARVAGGIAFGACILASAGVCGWAGLGAAAVSITKRATVDYHTYRRGGMNRSRSWGHVIRGSLIDIGFSRLPALRGAKVLRGRHRAGAYAPKLKRRWTMPRNRWAKRAVIGGYAAGLGWSMK